MPPQPDIAPGGAAMAPRLDALFAELERLGIDVSPDNQAAASLLLAQGRMEGARVERLAHRLSVLLAADEVEQEICRDAALALGKLADVQGPVVYSDAEKAVDEAGARSRKWVRASRRRAFAAAAVLVAVFNLAAAATYFSSGGTTDDGEPRTDWVDPDTFAQDFLANGPDGEATTLPPERFTIPEREPHLARRWVIVGAALLPLVGFAVLARRWWRNRVLWLCAEHV